MDTDRYIKIREELEELKRMIGNVNYQMQELRESIRGAPITTEKLPVPEPYVHPWWKHKWD
jgi:archaellum component FlaC